MQAREAGHQDRGLIEISYEAAQQDISRHFADMSSTRNWCVTGVLVYFGTIISCGRPIELWMSLPPVAAVIFALFLTLYERSNAELVQRYCQYAERALEATRNPRTESTYWVPPLQKWLDRNRKRRFRRKLPLYLRVACQRWAGWAWLVVLAVVIVLGTLLGQAKTKSRTISPPREWKQNRLIPGEGVSLGLQSDASPAADTPACESARAPVSPHGDTLSP
jgi:hypothetical protein